MYTAEGGGDAEWKIGIFKSNFQGWKHPAHEMIHAVGRAGVAC